MSELEVSGVEGNAVYFSLRHFFGRIFAVADDGVAERCELHADLVLQSCDQRETNEGRAAKGLFDGITKFRASCSGIFLGAQFLKHILTPQVVNELVLPGGEMPAHDGEILAHGSMREKLLYERIAIPFGFRKEQNTGRETVDAMHDVGALSSGFQFRGKN